MDSARRPFLTAANNEVRFFPGVCSTLGVVPLALLSGKVESDLNLVETPRLLLQYSATSAATSIEPQFEAARQSSQGPVLPPR